VNGGSFFQYRKSVRLIIITPIRVSLLNFYAHETGHDRLLPLFPFSPDNSVSQLGGSGGSLDKKLCSAKPLELRTVP
jgi:hypothetical protein